MSINEAGDEERWLPVDGLPITEFTAGEDIESANMLAWKPTEPMILFRMNADRMHWPCIFVADPISALRGSAIMIRIVP